MTRFDLHGLTSEDDALHPRTDDPWWTETVWFAWMVPERKLLGYFYPVFRPNLGVQFGGVLVVDDSATLPWELPFFEYDWHRRMPVDLDLRHMRLDNGMRLDCVEPGLAYDFGYEHRDLTFALRYEAIMPPLVTRGTPPFNNGHIDQIGRVRGSMTLHGDEIAVDCFAMRDRSWGPRQDGRQPKVGYAYATASPESCFLSISIDRKGDDQVSTGFHWRDGVWSRMASGTRRVDRDDHGRPARIVVDACDELGRGVAATGTVLSRQVFTAYPSMFCWNSLVQWSYDGTTCFGEDQDVWHPRRWREFAAALRRGDGKTTKGGTGR
jgi:hypothetical protein